MTPRDVTDRREAWLMIVCIIIVALGVGGGLVYLVRGVIYLIHFVSSSHQP